MWGLCVFSFIFSFLFFPLSFPLKEFRSQPFPERLKLWHRLSVGEPVITNNFTTLRNKMNTALIWRGPNWLCDLTVFKVPADLETGFMLAVVLPGKTEAPGLLLWGDRKTRCKLSCLSMELIYPPPSFFTVLLFLLLSTVLNLGAMPGFQLKCSSMLQKWQSECQGLLLKSVSPSVPFNQNCFCSRPKWGTQALEEEKDGKTGWSWNRLTCGHSWPSVTQSGRKTQWWR